MSNIGSRSRPRPWMLVPGKPHIAVPQRLPQRFLDAAAAPTKTPNASIVQSTETHATHLQDTYWQRRGSLLLLQPGKCQHGQRELRVLRLALASCAFCPRSSTLKRSG